MQGRTILVQHLFFSCVGITTQFLHLHQSGVSLPGGGSGLGCPSPATISPFTISAKAAGCLRSSSMASLRSGSIPRPPTKF